MKLYAVRDRLIDYFMTPFAADNDKQVLASLATAINNRENLDAIAKTPHHFEIWRIGEVDEEGHIHARKELLADCSSLIRANLRTDHQDAGGGRTAGQTANGQSGAPQLSNGPAGASERAIADGASAEVGPGKGTPRQTPGIPQDA